ncbi:hypothetical protein CEP52_002329 [Fusarium oligoseptatum]|uniref:Zn(2)-C6 fungal-type domain-containing protein n=1 Tax=Fusarium oligoseptatum TaxID=2604345 RepID=A0A428UE79_9HYPO|nr:hypothetical protein CEP52_002329 [Fusarium oligoseptatum]
MPRRACYACRSSKVRCKVQGVETSCQRCVTRQLHCSYIPKSHSSSRSDVIPSSPWESSEQGGFEPLPMRQANQDYRMERGTLGLDVGKGRPEDLLREGEFTHSLILLYFSNFSDIHFMFDEELFLADFSTSQIPKVILYSIMALSIRFSMAPFTEDLPPCHRGELLFKHARSLLVEDFDWPSVPTIQAYLLLGTYKLAFGGSRQAYVYLGFAANMLRALRLLDISEGGSSVSVETHRRLICTMALMDRLISFPLRLTPHFSRRDKIPRMLHDDEFLALKRGRANHATGTHVHLQSVSVSQEIMFLSEILAELYEMFQDGQDDVAQVLSRFVSHSSTRSESLLWTPSNISNHLGHDTLRQFAYMHMLYHHIGQLVHFKALKPTSTQKPYANVHMGKTFVNMFSRDKSVWAKAFNDNPHLLRQMLYLGSYYEKFDPRTAGRRIDIEALVEST